MIIDLELNKDDILWYSKRYGIVTVDGTYRFSENDLTCFPCFFKPTEKLAEVQKCFHEKSFSFRHRVKHISYIYEKYKELYAKKVNAIADLFLSKYFYKDSEYESVYTLKDNLKLDKGELKLDVTCNSLVFDLNSSTRLKSIELPNSNDCDIYNHNNSRLVQGLNKIKVGNNCTLKLSSVNNKSLIKSLNEQTFKVLDLSDSDLTTDGNIDFKASIDLNFLKCTLKAKNIRLTTYEDIDKGRGIYLSLTSVKYRFIDYISSPSITLARNDLDVINELRTGSISIKESIGPLWIRKLVLSSTRNKQVKIVTDHNLTISELIINPEIKEIIITPMWGKYIQVKIGKIIALGKGQTIETTTARDLDLYINNELVKDRIIQF